MLPESSGESDVQHDSATNPKLPYDLEKDLQAVAQATSLFYVVSVSPAVPATSVKELIKSEIGKWRKLAKEAGLVLH